MADLDDSPDPAWVDTSDPDVEKALIGLAMGEGETRSDKFLSPFQLADSMQTELVRRAEETGSRALVWNMSSIDRVGGRGTLRRIWQILKSKKVVGGRKRKLSVSNDDTENHKKPKQDLNITATCEEIMNLLLLSDNDGDDSVERRERLRSEEEGVNEMSGDVFLHSY